ncbi:hypothetical protein AVEN_91153-1 [Araneus ventricosus]|uniref:RNase H type-1 domain-containing protein n=1 Tax=Araneus ventricosus TaxID=182803 RepID=A0A4Y2E3X4_ARAVE|nr:hypothetical protein AVEN_91153-1 [Araneus ventricosus]
MLGSVLQERSGEASLKRRNADYFPVFRSEMIAIDMALDFVLEHQLFGKIWILSDSQSVVQYLVNWRCPGAAIHFKGDRKDQTALARLSSGHLKTLGFSRSEKFSICNMIEANLLGCVALVYDDLLKRPDFVLEVMRANDLVDLIKIRRIRKKTTILK